MRSMFSIPVPNSRYGLPSSVAEREAFVEVKRFVLIAQRTYDTLRGPELAQLQFFHQRYVIKYTPANGMLEHKPRILIADEFITVHHFKGHKGCNNRIRSLGELQAVDKAKCQSIFRRIALLSTIQAVLFSGRRR